jgi:ABC-type transport system involved in cytochrome c biogenesis permease component
LYLENSLNLILFIILPLMIPGLIFTTISLDLYSYALFLRPIYLINLGSSLVLMGVCLSLCSIIVKSIYNTEN